MGVLTAAAPRTRKGTSAPGPARTIAGPTDARRGWQRAIGNRAIGQLLGPGGVIQRQAQGLPATSTLTPATTPGSAPAPASRAPADPCATAVGALQVEALRWLDEAYTQLLDYETDEVIPAPAGSPPDRDHQRIGRTLQRTFNTRDSMYASVIRQRLLHVATLLRAGRISVTCPTGDPHCRAAGSEFTAAYVVAPYAIVMCGVPTVTSGSVATFVHELTHAVVPQIGIRAPLTASGQGVRDRAYVHERMFRFLTPEEALDNASSYEKLTEQLFNRLDAEVATSETETATSCPNPPRVQESVARFEQWTRDVGSWLHSVLVFLSVPPPQRPLDTLPDEDRARLAAHFPEVATVAGVRALIDFSAEMIHALSIGHTIACTGKKGACPDDVVGFGPTGTVTASTVTLRPRSTRESMNLCPSWFATSADDGIGSLFALFIITRPAWMTAHIRLSDAFRFVRLARDAAATVTPAPTTRDASQHLFHDEPAPSRGGSHP
jgi:hypothetical protein